MRNKLRDAFGRLRRRSVMEVVGSGNEARDRLNDEVTKKKRAQRRARHQLKRGNLIGLRLFSPIRKSFPLPVVVLPRRCLGIMRGESGNFCRSAGRQRVAVQRFHAATPDRSPYLVRSSPSPSHPASARSAARHCYCAMTDTTTEPPQNQSVNPV
jgi:hypothetical protein